jgi:signal transduction histidine kinase
MLSAHRDQERRQLIDDHSTGHAVWSNSEGTLDVALRDASTRSALVYEEISSCPWRAAYYVASEALGNAMKHAQASRVEILLTTRHGRLLLSIRDDGVGRADPARGSGLAGLAGLADRVEALGG